MVPHAHHSSGDLFFALFFQNLFELPTFALPLLPAGVSVYKLLEFFFEVLALLLFLSSNFVRSRFVIAWSFFNTRVALDV